MKSIILLSIFISTLFAQINFKETRHMEALDLDRDMFGNLEFNDEQMVVTYTKPNQQTITYHDDKITILRAEELKEYTFEQYPQAQYMGLILKAIIQDNYTLLDELFSQTVANTKVDLVAKPVISNVMDHISITKKEDKSIKNILITMTNKDTIHIEIID